MQLLSRLFAAAVLGAASLFSHAAVVHTHYTHTGGAQWNVDLSITNDDASPAQIDWFTVYFGEDLYRNLTLVASPATWDSLVVDTDPGIPASGYLDAFALDLADALALGQSVAGFTLSFDYLGANAPGALYFEILGEGFSVLAEGLSTVSVAPQAVPEPGSLALAALALGALGVARPARRRLNRAAAHGAL